MSACRGINTYHLGNPNSEISHELISASRSRRKRRTERREVNKSWVKSFASFFYRIGFDFSSDVYLLTGFCVLTISGKVHGSLARAGKVRGQTPKVAKQDKKKKPRGRAHKRLQHNRRFVTAGNFSDLYNKLIPLRC